MTTPPHRTPTTASTGETAGPPTSAELLRFVQRVAADPELETTLVPHPGQRTWTKVAGPGGSEAWLISWPPGSETGWHDHGGSHGAFAVARGALAEQWAGRRPDEEAGALDVPANGPYEQRLAHGQGRSFGARHVHNVISPADGRHTLSVHAYYPPLPLMRRYRYQEGSLVLEHVEHAGEWK